jgi:hypothetical protein
MLGPDSLIMYRLIRSFGGVLLTALIAQWYLMLRHRHAINTTALRRQLEAEEKLVADDGGVWPPLLQKRI